MYIHLPTITSNSWVPRYMDFSPSHSLFGWKIQMATFVSSLSRWKFGWFFVHFFGVWNWFCWCYSGDLCISCFFFCVFVYQFGMGFLFHVLVILLNVTGVRYGQNIMLCIYIYVYGTCSIFFWFQTTRKETPGFCWRVTASVDGDSIC